MEENYGALPNIPADVLQDLCSRFLINIPDNEKNDMVRICFQIELAHWYYIDFCRQDDPDLPTCGMKSFMTIIFSEFKFLNKSKESIQIIYENWKKYKVRVPVFGAILLSESLEKCLLVQGFHSKTSWGFPKGKVNKDEADLDCAIREVWEEVGYDIKPLANPDQYLENNIHDHQVRLYIIAGVSESYPFQTNTRGEIKDIQWFNINHLPTHKKDSTPKDEIGLMANNFFMIHSFIKPLRKWVIEKKDSMSTYSYISSLQQLQASHLSRLPHTVNTGDDQLNAKKKKKQREAEEFKRMHMLMNPLGSAKTDEDVLKSLLGMEVKNDRNTQPDIIQKLLSGSANLSPKVTPEKNKYQKSNSGFVTPNFLSHNQRQSPNTSKLYVNNTRKDGKLSYSNIASRGTKNTKDDKSRNAEDYVNQQETFQPMSIGYRKHTTTNKQTSNQNVPKSANSLSMKKSPKNPPKNKLTNGWDECASFEYSAPAFESFKFNRALILSVL